MFHVKSTQNLQKLAFYQLLFKTQETLREATVKANVSGACVSNLGYFRRSVGVCTGACESA